MKIYDGYGITYFEGMNSMNWIMNEIILETLTFEFMGSNNIGYGVVLQSVIFEFLKYEICGL